MSEEICASGFTGINVGQNGTYSETDRNLWYNGEFYIFRDFEYWKVCDCQFRFERAEAIAEGYSEGHLKAIKTFTPGSSPAGHYTGVDGNSDGDVVLGHC